MHKKITTKIEKKHKTNDATAILFTKYKLNIYSKLLFNATKTKLNMKYIKIYIL